MKIEYVSEGEIINRTVLYECLTLNDTFGRINVLLTFPCNYLLLQKDDAPTEEVQGGDDGDDVPETAETDDIDFNLPSKKKKKKKVKMLEEELELEGEGKLLNWNYCLHTILIAESQK